MTWKLNFLSWALTQVPESLIQTSYLTGPPGYLKGTATPAKVERTLDFSPFQHASLPIVVRARMLSCFGRIQLFATLWTIAPQAPLFMGFSKQEYWSGLPYSPPGDLPDPGIEPVSTYFSCIGRWVLYHLGHQRSPCLHYVSDILVYLYYHYSILFQIDCYLLFIYLFL